jgi:hypothetical protein
MASIMICQTQTDIGSRLIKNRIRRGNATSVITVATIQQISLSQLHL